MDTKKDYKSKENFHVPLEISSTPWRSNPENVEQLINTYGTYEIQPTANSSNPFPAISQGLPSESVKHSPKSFHEGIIPELND